MHHPPSPSARTMVSVTGHGSKFPNERNPTSSGAPGDGATRALPLDLVKITLRPAGSKPRFVYLIYSTKKTVSIIESILDRNGWCEIEVVGREFPIALIKGC